jgi:hypothetical protein
MIGCWTQDGSAPVSVITRLAPPSLQSYQRGWLPRDIVAGVTLAAVAIPEVMGYTSIAGGLVEHHTCAGPASPILTAG